MQMERKPQSIDFQKPPQIPVQNGSEGDMMNSLKSDQMEPIKLAQPEQPPEMPEPLNYAEDYQPDQDDQRDEEMLLKGKENTIAPYKNQLKQTKEILLQDRPCNYVFDFRDGAKDQDAMVTIEEMDEKNILRQENITECRRLTDLLADSTVAEQRYLGLMEKEVNSILDNKIIKHKFHKHVRRYQVDSTYRIMEIENTLSTVFKREEARVSSSLQNQQVRMEVEVHDFKDRKDKHVFSGVRDRYLKCSWTVAPQPIEVMIRRIRSPKDKIPPGDYILCCNILDRFAGNKIVIQREEKERSTNEVVPYSKIGEAKKTIGGNSGFKTNHIETKGIHGMFDTDEAGVLQELNVALQRPQEKFQVIKFKADDFRRINLVNTQGNIDYEGNYNSNDITFNDTVRLLAPSEVEIRPSNVLCFELIKKNVGGLTEMGGAMYEVHGWGLLPLINASSDIVEGKFKIPMMLGELDPSFDKFSDFEGAYARNLDEWLCNCYVEVRKINPRAVFEGWDTDLLQNLELKPLKIREEKPNRQGIRIIEPYQKVDPNSETGSLNSADSEEKLEFKRSRGERSLQNSSDKLFTDREPHEPRTVAQNLLGDYLGKTRNPFSKHRNSETNSSSKSEGSREGVAIHSERQKPSFKEDIDFGEDDLEGLEACFDDYFNKQRGIVYKARSSSVGKRKLKYIMDEILIDLGFNNRKSGAFVLSLIVTILALYIRIFLHYLGEYALLEIASVPIITTRIYFYKIQFEYIQNKWYIEFLVIFLGNLMNTVIFAFMMLVSFLFAKLRLKIPNIVSMFFSSFGIATFFDWLLICIVDLATVAGQYGDLYRLYWYYEQNQSAGIVGFFITLIIFFFVSLINAFLLYNYLVFVHKNGKILDLFVRISQDDQKTYFFLPGDNEISSKYLNWQLEKAKHYKYEEDAQKRVIIDRVKTFEKKGEYEFIKFYNNVHFYRLFVKMSTGTISEVDIQMMRKSKVNEHKLEAMRLVHEKIYSNDDPEDQNWSEHAQEESVGGQEVEEQSSRRGMFSEEEIGSIPD